MREMIILYKIRKPINKTFIHIIMFIKTQIIQYIFTGYYR